MSPANASLGRTGVAVLALSLIAALDPASPVMAAPSDFEPVVDDTYTITVDVSDSWIDRLTAPTEDEGWPHISAAPDIPAFRETYDVSGVTYVAWPYNADVDGLVGALGDPSGCGPPVEDPFDNGVFVGTARVAACGPDCVATLVIVVANPADNSLTAHVEAQAASDEELGDVDVVLQTLDLYTGGESMSETSTAEASVPAVENSETVPPSDAPIRTLPVHLLDAVAASRDVAGGDCEGAEFAPQGAK